MRGRIYARVIVVNRSLKPCDDRTLVRVPNDRWYVGPETSWNAAHVLGSLGECHLSHSTLATFAGRRLMSVPRGQRWCSAQTRRDLLSRRVLDCRFRHRRPGFGCRVDGVERGTHVRRQPGIGYRNQVRGPEEGHRRGSGQQNRRAGGVAERGGGGSRRGWRLEAISVVGIIVER